MKIYHYTSIDSFAQILKNKTIRFNRLDNVDDLEEGTIIPSGVKVGKFTYVSCWTETCEENLALWKLYTNSGIGVRIGIDWDMFMDYHNPEKIEIGGLPFLIKGSPYEVTKTPLQDSLNPNYIVVPIAKNEMLNIYKKVEYVDDVKESTEKIVKRIYGDYDNGRVTISLKELGRYKNKRWAFQEESRFCIAIFPGKVFSNIETFAKELDKWIYTCWVNNIDNNLKYYDMHLKENVFDSLEITLSPGMPESTRIIVEALKDKFAPSASIRISTLDVSPR